MLFSAVIRHCKSGGFVFSIVFEEKFYYDFCSRVVCLPRGNNNKPNFIKSETIVKYFLPKCSLLCYSIFSTRKQAFSSKQYAILFLLLY